MLTGDRGRVDGSRAGLIGRWNFDGSSSDSWCVYRMLFLVSFVVLTVGACGSGESEVPATSGAAGSGEALAREAGCASCHGVSFEGGVGPGWVGLAGSEVVLSDGSVVTAGDDYLFESIRDPGARVVDGFSVQMPRNSLSDAEIDEIVAFIRSLGSP
jgi:cytochrome c oxidase subunit 2